MADRDHSSTQSADRRPVPLLPPGAPLWFPPVSDSRESGLLAAGGDLSPPRLVYAYSHGIFPWYDAGTPILWWSPNPRCVLFPEEMHISRSLGKALRREHYTVSFNRDFTSVIEGCATVPRPGQNGTWLVPEMITAYKRLYDLGYVISAECWEKGELVGGVYGIRLGGVFFGESMFYHRPNASKAAFVTLVRHLQNWGVRIIDCQQTTPHMLHLGAREIPRREFMGWVERLVA